MLFPFLLKLQRKKVINKLSEYSEKFKKIKYKPSNELRGACQSVDYAEKEFKERTSNKWELIKSYFPRTDSFRARIKLAERIKKLNISIEEVYSKAVKTSLVARPKKITPSRSKSADYDAPKKSPLCINRKYNSLRFFAPQKVQRQAHIINATNSDFLRVGYYR